MIAGATGSPEAACTDRRRILRSVQARPIRAFSVGAHFENRFMTSPDTLGPAPEAVVELLRRGKRLEWFTLGWNG
jgi:hypothetical protein